MPTPMPGDHERLGDELDATSTSRQCAVCRRLVERKNAGADVRIYLGAGDKLAELWLPLCSHHVERFLIAHDQVIVECRVTSVDRGRPGLEAQR